MKTPSSIKTVLCLLLLPAVHAMATPVEINSDQTDYAFASGTTYHEPVFNFLSAPIGT